jgi:hypothetical protein
VSWTDKIALETIKQLRDEFNIHYFIETGTYKGINSLVQSKNFDYIFTCENNEEYLKIADTKLKDRLNVYLYKGNSPDFLKMTKERIERLKSNEIIFIFLDAHFYDTNLPKDKRFVVIDELKALSNFKNCVIAIHDFNNNKFSGIEYDGIKLDFNLLKEYLFNVNPNFKYYTNTKCDIYTEETIKEIVDDVDANDNIKYAWSKPEKTQRGILYCVPKEIDLSKYNLEEIK